MSRLSIAFAVLVSLSACGPSQTAREQEDEQEKIYIDQQRAVLGPLEGCYVGQIKPVPGALSQAVSLQLNLTTTFGPVPGRNKNVEIPTLKGNVVTLSLGESFVNIDQSNIAANGDLVSWSSSPSSGPSGEPGTNGIDVVIQGDRLYGKLYTRVFITNIDVTRTDDDSYCNGGTPSQPPQPEEPPKPKPHPHPPPRRH